MNKYFNYSLTHSINPPAIPYTAETKIQIYNLTDSAFIVTWQNFIQIPTEYRIYASLFDNSPVLFYDPFYVNKLWDPHHYYIDFTEIAFSMLLPTVITFSQLSFASAKLTDIEISDNILLTAIHYNTMNVSHLEKSHHFAYHDVLQGNDLLHRSNGLDTFYLINAFHQDSSYISITLDMLLLPVVAFSQLSFGAASIVDSYYHPPFLNNDLIITNSYSEQNSSEYF